MTDLKQENFNRRENRFAEAELQRIAFPAAIDGESPLLEVPQIDRWTNEGGAISAAAVLAAQCEQTKASRSNTEAAV